MPIQEANPNTWNSGRNAHALSSLEKLHSAHIALTEFRILNDEERTALGFPVEPEVKIITLGSSK
jgi:hypothetical protein